MTTIHVNHAKPSAAKAIIEQWKNQTCETLKNHDIEGHMALISKQVMVHGVPDLGSINYRDWAAQVEHEFTDKLIESVAFHGDHVRVERPDDIMFVTREVICAADGSIINNNLEVVLKKENDGVWRVIQERILDDEEARHFGLI